MKLKKLITVSILAVLLIPATVFGTAATSYYFVKPNYDVYLNDIKKDDVDDLLFNYDGYTYIKASKMCDELGLSYNWNEKKREARFYGNNAIKETNTNFDLIKNNKVGNEWKTYVKIKGMKATIKIIEKDTVKNDVTQTTINLKKGINSKKIRVNENNKINSKNYAVWKVDINVK